MNRDDYIAAAHARAEALYAGVRTPHRSCGVAIAETFGLPHASYQALRRGGITGEGPCGAIAAGVLALGELLGDPDPTGPVTPALREAVPRFRAGLRARLARADGALALDASCNARTEPTGAFTGPARASMCTALAADVAAEVAAALWDGGHARPLPPPPWATTPETPHA